MNVQYVAADGMGKGSPTMPITTAVKPGTGRPEASPQPMGLADIPDASRVSIEEIAARIAADLKARATLQAWLSQGAQTSPPSI